MDTDLGERVGELLEFDRDEFNKKVLEDTEFIKHEIAKGSFDNHQAIVGLEYEFYAADSETTNLARVPRPLLELIGFEKELGLHNAEMSTTPEPLNEYGLASQENEVKARLGAAQKASQVEGLRLVSDGIWTIPPKGETTSKYLNYVAEDDGVIVSPNISPSVRYHLMNNEVVKRGDIEIKAPNVSIDAETVAVQSLITSIQPHYQVPQASELPNYFSYAIRAAAPLLALGVNSPFFPPELYDNVEPRRIVEDAWEDHRIKIFEDTYNIGAEKVRFPREFDTAEEAIDMIAEDETYIPMPIKVGGSEAERRRFDDNFAHFNLKRGSFWRWIRPVFGGSDRTEAHARIEFRPISGQPTVRDAIGFQALFAGVLTALYRLDHPLIRLPWETACDNFYEATRDGLEAEMKWVNVNGDRTTSNKEIYDEVFELGVRGLRYYGVEGEDAHRYIWPIKKRAIEDMTPSKWKKSRVKQRLSEGKDLEDSVYGMKREYVDKQKKTLLEGSFADWL